jgi:hypothetical protein
MSAPYEGGCLCGQVRWKASAEPINVRLCHCRNCQRATGGPFFARAVFVAERIEWRGAVTRWPTSPRVERLSCARCGTPVFSQPNDLPARIGVALATFDDPASVTPDMHIWVSEKLGWVTIDDDLPRCAEGPQ